MESGGRLFFDPSACRGNMFYLGHGDNVFRGASSFMNGDEISKKRPFFSSSDDFFEEEYYDEQLQEKKRRLTSEQVHLLEKSFEEENKLEPERKSQLAKKLGLQPRQVAVWFQNRRARWKTKQLEKDYDDLKASLDSLRANYDSVVKENEKLKLEVASLAEKLQTKEVKTTVATEQAVVLGPGSANIDLVNVKVEDRVSSGSTGSAVVDDIDSGDSYFPNGTYPHHECVVVADDYSSVFAVEERNGEGEPLGWWVWP